MIWLAEDVLSGHPDRLGDAIAERLVDRAVAADPRALVGVEVCLFRDTVVVTGRVAASGLDLALEEEVRDTLEGAGCRGRWARPWRVEANLELGPLPDDERRLRSYSDDQNVVLGYAGSGARGLPAEVVAVRALRRRLESLVPSAARSSDRTARSWSA